jgi:hypothetical protein
MVMILTVPVTWDGFKAKGIPGRFVMVTKAVGTATKGIPVEASSPVSGVTAIEPDAMVELW